MLGFCWWNTKTETVQFLTKEDDSFMSHNNGINFGNHGSQQSMDNVCIIYTDVTIHYSNITNFNFILVYSNIIYLPSYEISAKRLWIYI